METAQCEKKKTNKPTTKKKSDQMVCPEKKMHADIYIARFGRLIETFFQKFNLIHIVTYLSMYIWQGTSKNLCVPV